MPGRATTAEAFEHYLALRGWAVEPREPRDTSVVGRRGAELLIAETTFAPDAATSVSDLYARILQRMSEYPDARHYAIVVPERLRGQGERLPAWVRVRLRLDVFVVDELNHVRKLHPGEPIGRPPG